MTTYDELAERVHAIASLLPSNEQADARRVATLCRALDSRPRTEERLDALADDLALRRELGKLAEVLGRRSAYATPAAALARAALADLSGDLRSRNDFLRDCDAKLSMFGL